MPKKITDVSKKILDAALQIYHEEGLEKVSIRKIAGRSGLAVGTVYNRFGDKEDLLAQVLAGDIEQFKVIIMENVFGKQPEEALRAIIESFIERMMSESNNIIKYVADMHTQRGYIIKILNGACRQINELLTEIIYKVYYDNGTELPQPQLELISEMALSMMQVASQYRGEGGKAERTDIVYDMIISYSEHIKGSRAENAAAI